MSKRALVVEDDSNIAELLRLYLGKDGFEVMIAPDGGKAESSFDLFQPDVVLLDIMLPVKDGWQVCRDIRKKSAVPIIMLTAKGETSDKVSGLEMGADDYVTKPFEPEYLRARVQNILAQRTHLEQSYRQRLMRLEPQKTEEPVPGDAFLAKLLDVMDKQMDNNTLTVDELVEEMNMGRTVFFNKLKNLTGLSPVEFIREMRIKRAAQLLEDRKYNITEVTYMVGMNDSRYFSKCFKNTYGVTPSEYRKQRLGKE
jgi:DNA-binding response OmpR family regulator